MKNRAFLASLLFLTLAPAAWSQNQTQPACASPEFRQFDFWVGEWELSWPASETSGRKPGRGTNRIERALDDCVIVEHFVGTPSMDLRGMSVSTFNKRKGKWQQTWVDNSGGYLDFVGEFKDGQMILAREAVVSEARKFLQRMVWKNIQPDSLDWSWERSDDGGQTWKVLWPIHYQRLTGALEAPALLGRFGSSVSDHSDIKLPAPTGPHAVGTVIQNWTDSSRDDIVSELPDDNRQSIVQIWYSAEVERSSQQARYMPELAVLGVIQTDVDRFAGIRTNSMLHAKLSNAQAKYPVVVFSHGRGTPRSYYTMLMEELASHGYVVAGIDHPYVGRVAMGGKILPMNPRWVDPPRGGLRDKTDEERDRYWSEADNLLSVDQRFVLDQLKRLGRSDPDNRFTGRLDLTHVGMAGHSKGFVSQTCGRDTRFKACLNLDGVPALAERECGFRQPFMTIRDGDDSPRTTTIYENLRNVGYDVLIRGAGHNSYLDLPLLAEFDYRIDPIRSRRIINAYMLAFFDTYLKGQRSRLLEHLPEEFPEVVFTVHGARAIGKCATEGNQ